MCNLFVDVLLFFSSRTHAFQVVFVVYADDWLVRRNVAEEEDPGGGRLSRAVVALACTVSQCKHLLALVLSVPVDI